MRQLALGLALALAGTGGASAQQAGSPPVVIEVTGSAIVTVAPDQATVPVTVVSTEETSSAASARTEREVARLVAFMKTLGAVEEDIRVEPIRVLPKGPQTYPLVRDEKPGDATATGPAPVKGFQASSQIQVRFTDLAKAAQFVSQARDNGASGVNVVRYSVGDPANGAGRARQAAFDAARQKAERLALMAGLKLGRVIRISMPSRDLLAAMAGMNRSTDSPQTDDVIRIEASVPKAKSVEVRASLDVAWAAE